MMRILAVAGDNEVLTHLEVTLGHRNFNVYGTDMGEEAVDLGKLYAYDAIVLSATTDMHTDTVIRNLRSNRVKTPILVLGAEGGAVSALNLGADDHMTLPFHIDELTARLHNLVRRCNGHVSSVLQVGELVLNLDTRLVTYTGQSIHLTGKEFAMLELLALRKGCVQSKEQILNSLYGGMDEPELKIIDVFICKLRRKLTTAGAPPDLIETVWGRGYLIRGTDDAVVKLPPAVTNPVGRMMDGSDTFGVRRAGRGVMGAARLIHGDFMDVVRTIPSESVDLIATDPPYKVISGGTSSPLSKKVTGVIAKNDGKIFKFNDITPRDYMPEFYRLLRPGRDAYVMTNNITLQQLLEASAAAGFKFHGMLAWVKNTCTPNRWYLKNFEPTVYLYKPPARAINDMGSKQTFFADNPRDKVHPTEKPVSLMQHYIENSSEPGWTVLDPFMGSGTTGVAARNTGRNFIGIERDPEYFAICQRRILPAPVVDFSAFRAAVAAETAAHDALATLKARYCA